MATLVGIALLIVGVAQPPAQSPRSYFVVPSVPLILFGLGIPLAPPSYGHCLSGLVGLVTGGLEAAVMHWHLRRRLAERGDHVAD